MIPAQVGLAGAHREIDREESPRVKTDRPRRNRSREIGLFAYGAPGRSRGDVRGEVRAVARHVLREGRKGIRAARRRSLLLIGPLEAGA